MELIKWDRIMLTDAKGEKLTGAKVKKHLQFRIVSVQRGGCYGYACYLSCTLPQGMAAEGSIVLRPKIADTGEFIATINHSSFWCLPQWGTSLSELHERTQELLMQQGEEYVCYLPVCADVMKTVIRGCEGGMEFVMSSNLDGLTECREQLAFVCMAGNEPFTLFRAIAEAASALLGNGLRMREKREYPEAMEYLGWCSWDAFQIRVNHKGLLQKAEEFKSKQVPIRYAIIDDMWADAPALNQIPSDISFMDMVRAMHQSKLRSFEGDPMRFPEGMKATVTALKQVGISHVGIWFPTTGYWNGIDAEGDFGKEIADLLTSTANGKHIPKPEHKAAEVYFDLLCGKVRSWGADFVKIDNQGFHGNYRNLATYGESADVIQSAIDRASQKHFGGALINCMGMPNECLFHRTESAVCRCSDDFMPESREWFSKNILECAYSGLLQGQYHVNDWDMWWTDDEQAIKNSVCRAVSGGPIYVSDKLDRTHPEILKPLSLSNGRILRCDNSAMPTADCLMKDPTKTGRIFKIQNRVGKNAVLATFNISEDNRTVSGLVSPADCGLSDGEYAWYEYFSGTAGILSAKDDLQVTLKDRDELCLYSFVPLADDGIAVMGRLDLYIGVKAAERQGDRVCMSEGGKLGIVSRNPVTVALLDGTPIPTCRMGVLTTVDVAQTDSEVSVLIQ